MINRIKHFALLALLMVPAMAQASAAAASTSAEVKRSADAAASVASGADRKYRSEKHYDRYGNEINKAEAHQNFADLMNEKMDKKLNPIAAWGKRNPWKAALAGAALWSASAAPMIHATGIQNDSLLLYAFCYIVPASVGALYGEMAARCGRFDHYALGGIAGAVGGRIAQPHTDVSAPIIGTFAATTVGGIFLGRRN